jgi:hypothetical protein
MSGDVHSTWVSLISVYSCLGEWYRMPQTKIVILREHIVNARSEPGYLTMFVEECCFLAQDNVLF